MTDDRLQDAYFEYDRPDQGVYCLDRNLVYVFVNKTAEAQMRRKSEDVVNRHYHELFPGDYDSIFIRSFQRALDSQTVIEFDYKSRVTAAEFHCLVMPTQEGLTMVLRALEGTGPSADQKELLGSAFFNNSQLGYMILKNPDKISLINQRGADLLGIPMAKFRRINFTDLFDPSVKNSLLAPLHNIFLQPNYTYNFESLIKTEGGSRWVSGILSNLVDDPAIRGVLFTFFDFDILKRQELSARRLGYSIDKDFAISDRPAVIVRRYDGVAIAANQKFLDLLGYTRDQVVGEKPLNLIEQDSVDRILEFNERLSQNVAIVDFPIRLRGEDGSVSPFLMSANPFEIEGLPVFYITLNRTGKITSKRSAPKPAIDVEKLTDLVATAEDRERNLRAERALVEQFASKNHVLYDVSRYLLEYEGEHLALTQVAEMIANGMGYDRVSIVLLDTEHEQVTGYFRGGPGKANLWRNSYAEFWEGLVGWVIRNGETAISPKDYTDMRESQAVFTKRVENNAGSTIVCPIKLQRQVVGTLTAINGHDQPDIPESDHYLLETIADQIASAVRNFNLVQSLSTEIKARKETLEALRQSRDELDEKVITRTLELTRSNSSLATVGACNDIIQNANGEQELLVNIVDAIVRVGGFKFCWVAKENPQSVYGFEPYAVYNKTIEEVSSTDSPHYPFYNNFTPMEDCIRDRRPIVIDDLTSGLVYSEWMADAITFDYRSMICLPILVDDELFGGIFIAHAQESIFDQTQQATLATIIQNISVGIASIRAKEENRKTVERFRLAFHSNPAGNLLISLPEGIIVDVNKTMLDWIGYYREEMIGKSALLLKPFGQNASTSFRKIVSFNERGTSIKDLEVPARTRTGKEMVFLLSAQKLEFDGLPHAIFTAIDITETVRMRRELEETRESLVAAQKLAKLGNWEYDVLRGTSKWSPELYELFGYPDDEPIPDYLEIAKKVHPDDRQEWISSLEDVQSKKMIISHIYRYFPDSKSGRMYYYEANNSPIIGNAGEVLQSRGTVQDVTEETINHVLLQEASEKLETAQSFAQVGSWAYDFETKTFSGSRQTNLIFEWRDQRPYTTKEFQERVHPDNWAQIIEKWAMTKQGEPFDAEYRIMVPSGIKWIHGIGALESDPSTDKNVIVGSIQDITERKLSQLAIEERDYKLSQLILSAPTGITIIDANGNFSNWNPAMTELTGFSEEEALSIPAAQILSILSGTSDEDRQTVESIWASIRGMLETGEIPPGMRDWIHPIFSRDEIRRSIRHFRFIFPEGDHFLIAERYQDVTHNQIQIQLAQSRLELIDYAFDHSLLEVAGKALDLLEELLSSGFSFFNTIQSPAVDFSFSRYSTATLQNCSFDSNLVHDAYLPDKLWQSAIQSRTVTVINTFEKCPELPGGHQPIQRLMYIPVIRNEQAVAIVGIANKPINYTDMDKTVAEEFMDFAYEIIERRAKTEEIQRLWNLIDNSNDLIATLDEQLLLDYVNPAGHELLGISNGFGSLNVKLIDFLALDSKRTLREQVLPSVRVSGSWNGELRFNREKGDPVVVYGTFSRSLNADQSGYTLIAADLTELKQTESQLILSQRRAESLLNAVPDMIFRFDAENRIVDYKDMDDSRLCLSYETILEHQILEVLPEPLGGQMAELMNVARNSGQVVIQTFEMQTASGTGFFEARIKADLSSGEVIAVVRDLTELHDSMEELRKYKDHLEKMVAERTAQLEQARDLAEAANHSKSDFLAMMSHEIRTPLNGVLGLAELLGHTELNPDQENYLEHIRNSGQSLLAIINDVLDFSKIEADKMEIVSEDFDLDDLLTYLSESITFQVAEKGLELRTSLPPEIPRYLRGDIYRLKQVLINLTSNAIKFTEKGFIEVKVEEIERSGNQLFLRFSIVDSGIGMSQKQLRKIFQPFTQADNSTSRRYGGTGLGLVISQRILGLMGGKITVESRPGEGSSFAFVLPFEFATGAPENRLALLDKIPNLNILIADRQGEEIAFLASILQSNAFPVHEVHEFKQMIDFIKSCKHTGEEIPLVLVASDLPGLKLPEGLVEARKGCPRLSVILLSAAGFDPHASRKFGADGQISKPYIPTAVVEKILEVLSKKKYETGEVSLPNEKKEETFHAELILLVEDNPINQMVAKQFLERMNLRVMTAKNGIEALSLVEKQSFAMVLMDIQMPDMDGNETTRRLRTHPQELVRGLPIIAMTAHALKGEKEKALKMGMNDYITKPIDVAELRATVAKWLPVDGRLVELDTPTTSPPSSADNSALDDKEAINRLAGDKNLYEQVLRIYLSEHADDSEKIRAYLRDGDLESAYRVAHTVRSVAGTIGAPTLAEISAQVESELREERLSAAQDLLDLMEEELNRTIGMVSRYLTGK